MSTQKNMNPAHHKHLLIRSILRSVALTALLLSNLVGAQLLGVTINSTRVNLLKASPLSIVSNLETTTPCDYSWDGIADHATSSFSGSKGDIPLNTPSACPTITLAPPTFPDGVVGAPYNQQITLSDVSIPYTFTITAGTLPSGIKLSPTGGLSGIPTKAGMYSFTVTATGGTGCTGINAYTIIVGGGTCPPVALSPGTLQNGVVGIAYAQQITASDPSPYIFTASAGTLPPGLTLTPMGGLSGAPTTAGTYSFTLTGTGGSGCSGSQTFTITVTAGTCPAITLLPARLPNGILDVAYSQQITVSDLSIPYLFTITAGTLPSGLSLTPIGMLSGAPTAMGTYSFTITASGGNGCTGSMPYTVIVTASNCAGIILSPAILPNGVLGTGYKQQISVNDSSPFNFAVNAGALPEGLILAPFGGLSGVPKTVGTYSFSITAMGDNGCAVGQTYTISISSSAEPHSRAIFSMLSGGLILFSQAAATGRSSQGTTGTIKQGSGP